MNFELTHSFMELDISLTKASLTIIEMVREDIELEYTELRKNTADELFEVTCNEGFLSIKEKAWKKQSITPGFLSESVSTDLTLKIPAGTKVRGNVATLSGDINAESLLFNGKFKTVSGTITLGKMESTRLRAHSVIGSVTIAYIKGGLSGKSVSGQITVNDGEIKDLSLSGVSGDILLSGKLALKSNGSIHTVSGNIGIDISEYQGESTLSLSTLSGNITHEGIPEDKLEIKKRMPFLKDHPFKTIMPDLKNIFSSFGKVMDRSNVEVKTESDPAGEQHVRAILDMVAEGKITVDEAEKLIKAIKGA